MGISDVDSLLDCPPSYICSGEGSSVYEKIACALGHYCPAGTNSSTQYPCPPGTYSNSYEAIAKSDCILCPRGFACGEGCTINDFLICEPGHYCPRGTASVFNEVANAYEATMYPCPAGTYREKEEARRIQDCIPCDHGSYCLSGTAIPDLCPAGYYCPLGTKFDKEYPCRPGTYSELTGRTTQEQCKKCGLGNFCEGGGTEATKCPDGYYNNLSEEASQCYKCPAGSYCKVAAGATTGIINPTPCDEGTYSEEEATECIECEEGHFCPEKGISKEVMLSSFRCYAGMFCSGAALKKVYPRLDTHGCTAGKYCPEATTVEIDCPVGTYNPFKGRGSVEECFITPAGHYTDTPGSTSYKECHPGHFCLSGSSDPKEYPCPAGTFRSLTAGATPEDCAVCWAGFKCPIGTANPISCDEGYYCPLGTTIPEACPEGTFSNKKELYDSQACTPCPEGKYCPQRGLTVATELCDEGFYCMGGSKRPEPTDRITGNLCPKTGYCVKGTPQPEPCPKGTQMVIEGAYDVSQCVPCLAGYYCDGELKEQPTGQCEPGHYCRAGSDDKEKEKVAIGHYAPLGSRHPYQCPFGTFAKVTGSATCDGCDGGSVCTGIGLTDKDICPEGYYCPAYTWFENLLLTYDKYSCPQGTYNPVTGASSSTDCVPCTGGSYCATRACTGVTGICAEGFFCATGSPYKKPPKTAENDYGICPPGKFCPQETATPNSCPQGYYSASEMLKAQSECLPCYEGKYCATAGITEPTDDCAMGYYCVKAETVPNPNGQTSQFPLYCPQGSGVCINCPTGFYQDKNIQGVCFKCPKGEYCYAGTKHACSAGYFCP